VVDSLAVRSARARWLGLDRHLGDLRGESVAARLVVVGHGGLAIEADVHALVPREREGLRLGNVALGDLETIDGEHTLAAGARLRAVGREVVPDDVLS